MTQTQSDIRALQVIAGTMIMGVVMFLGVVLFLRTQGTVPFLKENPNTQLYSWISLGGAAIGFVVSFALAGVFAGDGTNPMRARGAVIARLAMNEGGALLGIVILMLTGELVICGLAIGIGLIGLALTFPRAVPA